MQKLNRWQNFQVKCEDTTLKIDADTLKSLGYTRVHSNFEYYDDGSFVNVSPFQDINKMFNDVFGGSGI